jgi:hypothetical protein
MTDRLSRPTGTKAVGEPVSKREPVMNKKKILTIALAAIGGLIFLDVIISLAASSSPGGSSGNSPSFACTIVPTGQAWQADVTVNGPTPDVNGGAEIFHLILGYYDANGDEFSTGWAMDGLNGFSVAAGQSITYHDVDSGSSPAPASCQVQSY